MKKILKYSFFVIFSLLFNFVFAQSTPKDEESLKKMLLDFAKAYENLPNTKKKETVLQYISPELVSMNILSRVDGKIQGSTGDFQIFSDYLDKVIRTENFKVTYKVSEINAVKVRGTTGVIVYTVDYEFAKDGTAWSQGIETVMMTCQKQGAGWKVLHFTFVNVEDQKFKGTCLCEFFKAPSGDFVAKTTVPNGKTYTTELNNFVFRNTPTETIISVNEQNYVWKKSDRTITTNPIKVAKDSSEIITLGKADSEEEAIVLIIQQSLYVENCASFKIKSK